MGWAHLGTAIFDCPGTKHLHAIKLLLDICFERDTSSLSSLSPSPSPPPPPSPLIPSNAPYISPFF